MDEALRVILPVLVGLAALTTATLGLSWWMEPDRSLRRAMRRALMVRPQAEAISPAEGRAAALDVDQGQILVLWKRGRQGLAYDFDEVEGGEIIVDGHVVARVRRGHARKTLDVQVPDAERVTLRLMFRDARHPEFELALWNAQAPGDTASPAEALRLGRRWLSHLEALLGS